MNTKSELTSGIILTASSHSALFRGVIDRLEKCPVPPHAERILARYVEHLRYVTAHPEEPTEEMRACVPHVLSIFPNVQAFRLLPQIFNAVHACRDGEAGRAFDILLCVECALTLSSAAA